MTSIVLSGRFKRICFQSNIFFFSKWFILSQTFYSALIFSTDPTIPIRQQSIIQRVISPALSGAKPTHRRHEVRRKSFLYSLMTRNSIAQYQTSSCSLTSEFNQFRASHQEISSMIRHHARMFRLFQQKYITISSLALH